MSWFYYISSTAVHIFFLAFTRWRIVGKENIPRTGAVMAVGNHLTFAEPCIVSIILRRPSRIAAKEGFFRNRLLGKIMSSYGAFPVHPGKADRETVRLMEEYVKQGFALGIFPEGTRSQNGALIPALNGAALIAHRTNVPILPIAITGTEKMRGKFWFIKRPVIHINIGPQFQIPSGAGKMDRSAATKLIMRSIADLLPPEYRGVYAEGD